MRDRIHLGEALGLGGILFVATPAEVGHIGQLGDMGRGVIRMLGQRSMARLAGHSRVLAAAVHFALCVVTHHTLFVAGISNRPGGDHVERTRAVVSIFPKVLGHHQGAENQKGSQSSQ